MHLTKDSDSFLEYFPDIYSSKMYPKYVSFGILVSGKQCKISGNPTVQRNPSFAHFKMAWRGGVTQFYTVPAPRVGEGVKKSSILSEIKKKWAFCCTNWSKPMTFWGSCPWSCQNRSLFVGLALWKMSPPPKKKKKPKTKQNKTKTKTKNKTWRRHCLSIS